MRGINHTSSYVVTSNHGFVSATIAAPLAKNYKNY